jgi:hypothetical protein
MSEWGQKDPIRDEALARCAVRAIDAARAARGDAAKVLEAANAFQTEWLRLSA